MHSATYASIICPKLETFGRAASKIATQATRSGRVQITPYAASSAAADPLLGTSPMTNSTAVIRPHATRRAALRARRPPSLKRREARTGKSVNTTKPIKGMRGFARWVLR
jgi:hypothetical protein